MTWKAYHKILRHQDIKLDKSFHNPFARHMIPQSGGEGLNKVIRTLSRCVAKLQKMWVVCVCVCAALIWTIKIMMVANRYGRVQQTCMEGCQWGNPEIEVHHTGCEAADGFKRVCMWVCFNFIPGKPREITSLSFSFTREAWQNCSQNHTSAKPKILSKQRVHNNNKPSGDKPESISD